MNSGNNVKRDLKVGVSGVRGIVGESLTPSLAAAFTAAPSNVARYMTIMPPTTVPRSAAAMPMIL